MRSFSPLSRAEVQELGNERGFRADSQYFSVSGIPSQTRAKIVIVVSKAVAKRATSRNVVRRRIRHAIHDILCSKRVGGRIMIRAKKPALDMSYEAMRSTLEALLDELVARYNART